MGLIRRLGALSSRHTPLPNVPLRGGDARWSAICWLDPDAGDPELVSLALAAAGKALTTRLSDLEARCGPSDAQWVRTWPGEHYRLLSALVRTIDANNLVEIGTFQGHGALAAKMAGASVVTYDIVPWQSISGAILKPDDAVEQRIGDLGEATYRATQRDVLQAADIIFIDGPKDGHWEKYAIPAILSELTDRRRLVMLDDIRLLPMVQLWHDLAYPKLDVTSLGHWSGTGLLFTA